MSLNAQLGGGPWLPPRLLLVAFKVGQGLACFSPTSHPSCGPLTGRLSRSGSWGPMPRRGRAQVGEAAARSGQAGSSAG